MCRCCRVLRILRRWHDPRHWHIFQRLTVTAVRKTLAVSVAALPAAVVRYSVGLSGLRTVPLVVAVAVIHVTALALAAVDTGPYYVECRMRRCRMRLWFHLLRCWRRPYPPNAGYSRVWVRGLSRTCQRVYPARFMGARHTPPHVPTGLVSLLSLECVRGDGVQVIHCGIGCRLYLAGSPRGTAYERHPCRKGWPILTQVVAYEVVHHSSCLYKFAVIDRGLASDADLLLAMSAHWCTLVGLSVGSVDMVNLPRHTHFRSRRMTWRITGGVYP